MSQRTHNHATRTLAIALSATLGLTGCAGPGAAVGDPGPGPVDPVFTDSPNAQSDLVIEREPDDFIETSEPVGTLPGNMRIGPDGESHYSMNLDVPPGRNGLQPNMSVRYASHAGVRALGKGWKLSVTSSIARCPERIKDPVGEFHNAGHFNYFPDSPEASQLDALCLDGKLLYPLNAEGSEYGIVGSPETQVDAHFENGLNAEVGWFDVSYSDGRRRTYGYDQSTNIQSPDARVIAGNDPYATDGRARSRRWMLAAEYDSFDNFIQYDYDTNTLELDDGLHPQNHLLNSITYVGGAIEFTYGNDPVPGDVQVEDARFHFWRGGASLDNRYLKQIQILGPEDGLQRTYEFEYARSDVSSEVLLASATVCDRDGVCLPATTFEYSENAEGSETVDVETGVSALSLNRFESERLVPGDFNGDGRADIAFVSDRPDTGPTLPGTLVGDRVLKVALSEVGGGYGPLTILDWTLDAGYVRVGDTDGDGRTELISVWLDEDTPNFTVSQYDLDDSSTWSSALHTFATEGCGVGTPHCRGVQALDVVAIDHDGDGADEILTCARDFAITLVDHPESPTPVPLVDPGSPLAYWTELSGQDQQAGAPAFATPCASSCNGLFCERNPAYEVLDVNGDGSRDLLQVKPLLPDSVASGLGADADTFSAGSHHYVALGAALPRNGLDTNLPLDFLQRYSSDSPFGVSADKQGDVNGDGLVDIVRFEPVDGDESRDDASTWVGPNTNPVQFEDGCGEFEELVEAQATVYINRGNGRFIRSSFPLADFDESLDFCEEFRPSVLVDYNGDRLSDLLVPPLGGNNYVANLSGGGVSFATTETTGWYAPDPDAERQPTEPAHRRPAIAFDSLGTGRAGLLYPATSVDDEEGEVKIQRFGEQEDLLTRVVDGHGKATEVEYSTLADSRVFSTLPCPEGHQSVVPRRSVATKISHPFPLGARFQEHQFAGMCASPPFSSSDAYQRHVVTSGVELGGGTSYYRRTTEYRDNYDPEVGVPVYRGRPSRVETLEWFAADGRFSETIRTSEYDYIEDFFQRPGDSGLDLSWVPVGRVVRKSGSSRTTEVAGTCALEPSAASDATPPCTATAAVEEVFVSFDRVHEFDAVGSPVRRIRRVGETCEEHSFEYYDWDVTRLERLEVRPGRVTQSGASGDGAVGDWCELADESKAVVQEYEYHPETLELEASVLQPDSNSSALRTELERADAGQITKVTESAVFPEGEAGTNGSPRVWELGFDSNGVNPEWSTNPLGHTTSYDYHPTLGFLLEVTDANDVHRSASYDGFGRVRGGVTAIKPAGSELIFGPRSSTSYERISTDQPSEPSRLRIVTSTEGGGSSLTEHDERGREVYAEWDVSETQRAFSVTHYNDGLSGLEVESSLAAFVGEPTGAISRTQYDPSGRVLLQEPAAADLGPTSYSYVGRQATRHAPAADWTTIVDTGGRIVEEIDGEGTSTCYDYEYGARLNAVLVNPPGGCGGDTVFADSVEHTSTSFAYDALGRTVVGRAAGLATETSEYNAFGEVWRSVDSDGATLSERDALGRLVRREDATGDESEFVWDSDGTCTWADGFLRSHATSDGTIRSFEYDRFGRTRTEHLKFNGEELATRYGYDGYSRLAEVRLPDGGPLVERQYDSVGRLAGVSADGAALWAGHSRAANGRLIGELHSNGVQTSRNYVEGLLRSYETTAPNMTEPFPGFGSSMSVIDSIELDFDEEGNVERRAIPHLNLEENFTYDAIGRLETGMATQDGNVVEDWSQEYWRTGAIRSRTGVDTYDYDDERSPLGASRVGDVHYEYDREGRQRRRASADLTWTPLDRLETVVNGDRTTTFEYDALGSRVRKLISGADSSDTLYFGGLRRESDDERTTWDYSVTAEEGSVALLRRTKQHDEVQATWETLRNRSPLVLSGRARGEIRRA